MGNFQTFDSNICIYLFATNWVKVGEQTINSIDFKLDFSMNYKPLQNKITCTYHLPSNLRHRLYFYIYTWPMTNDQWYPPVPGYIYQSNLSNNHMSHTISNVSTDNFPLSPFCDLETRPRYKKVWWGSLEHSDFVLIMQREEGFWINLNSITEFQLTFDISVRHWDTETF